MSDNPHVRPIHIFQPKEELRIENMDPRRRPPKKKSVNPVAGLLDEADAAAESERPLTQAAGATKLASSPTPAAAASGSHQPKASSSTAESSEISADALLGEVPEVIEGDFPEPVDL